MIAHQAVQAFKALAHIDGVDGNVDLGGGARAKHGYAVSEVRISRAKPASTKFQLDSMRRPLRRVSVKLVEIASCSAATVTRASRGLDLPAHRRT
jgi:hypothetical protein